MARVSSCLWGLGNNQETAKTAAIGCSDLFVNCVNIKNGTYPKNSMYGTLWYTIYLHLPLKS